MKKLLSILALALCFVACQNEGVENVANGDLVDVVLTVDAPELGVTRADGDTQNGKNSAFGAIDFLSDADWANYDLRYILEVYAENETGEGKPIYSERLVNCLDKYAPTTFSLRLVPNRTYKFVVFADFVAEGNAKLTEPAEKLAIADLYYNTADLRDITAITAQPTWGAMNEIRDAYFVTQNITISNLGHTESLTLTRPFAKLRVITTDLSYIAGYSAPGYVEVTYHDTDVFKSFNAVNGNLNTEKMTGEELKYGYNVNKAIPYSEGYDAFATNQTLFTDYLFAVEGQQTTVKFTMTIYESEGGREIHSHDFCTEIPIQRNHLTTIIGDLCTTQANITFDINDNFEDEFVIGWDDSYTNKIAIDSWSEGQLTDNGDYAFTLSAEGKEFTVTVNGKAVENGALTEGSYVLAEDAAEGNIYTFTVEGLEANATTRAMTDVEVIGGKMVVEKNEADYNIELNLVVEFAAEEFVRYSSYTYEGALSINKPALATPEVTATVNDNVVTLTWEPIAGAKSYNVTVDGTTKPNWKECTYTFTGEYETEYTFSVVAVPTDSAKYSNSAAGTVKAKTADVTALATPVVGATVVDNKVTLTWNEVEGAAKYSVTVNGTTTPNIKKTSFEFTGNYETEYTFKVVAYPADEAKHTPSAAAEVTAKTADVIVLDTPVVTVAKDVKTITLTWNAVENAAYYTISGGTEMPAVVEGTEYTFVGEYDTAYTFNVVAVPADEAKYDASEAAVVEVKTDAIITLATPNVTATPSKNTITLSWIAVENAAYYTISGATEETVYGTEYTFEGEYDTDYTFYVVAVPENNVKYAASEAAVVKATTEAEPVDPYIYLQLEDDTWKSFTTVEARIPTNNNRYTTVELEDLGNDLYRVEKSELAGKTFYFYGSKRNYSQTTQDQTGTLTVRTNGDNLYTITSYGEGWNVNASGEWSKKN